MTVSTDRVAILQGFRMAHQNLHRRKCKARTMFKWEKEKIRVVNGETELVTISFIA